MSFSRLVLFILVVPLLLQATNVPSVWNLVDQKNWKAIESNVKKNKSILNSTNEYGESLFMRIVAAADVKSVRTFLKYKPDVNFKTEEGNTALSLAVGEAKHATVEELLKAKADLSWKDSEGYSILALAIRESDLKMIEILVRAEPKLLDPKQQKSPISLAQELKNESVLQLLNKLSQGK